MIAPRVTVVPDADREAAALHQIVHDSLIESRTRVLELLFDIADDDLLAQHSPLMSPMVWDLAHIANYEEQWLLRALDGRPAIDADLDGLYDAFEHPRSERPSLPLLAPAAARRYASQVRTSVLELLNSVDLETTSDRRRVDPASLLAGGFVYGMVIQHEHQHAETLLATRQLMGDRAPALPGMEPPPASARPMVDEVRLPGGRFQMGTSSESWAYDNEQHSHPVELAPFWLETTPVTNAAYGEFVGAGGYDDPHCWTDAGWTWRQSEGLEGPQFWTGECVLRFGELRSRNPVEPVQHVCWYEADAYARWAGKRLPTEAEWEYAATWHPDGYKRRFPWGDDAHDIARRANLGQHQDGPAPVGAFTDGANPWGVESLLGDVWEWTSSRFEPYPGFEPFPYREYSEVFFPKNMPPTDDQRGYRVLRGGSWATHPTAVRGTFRNWDHPIRRQIFAGFRCARDDR